MLFFLPLVWTGCGDARTPAQPTAEAVPAAGAAQSASRAGAVVVAGTGATLGNDGYA